MYRSFIKPFLDRVVALLAILLLSPVLIVIFILLLIFQRGQVIFSQERPGFREVPFKILKFKTMRDQRDDDGKLLPEVRRVTKMGSLLRMTSFDELPQLINVLKGEMSIVGPRPLPTEYLMLYSKDQRQRHSVYPGITGWSQVNGRHEIPWAKKLDLDLYYIKHISLGLDLFIIVRTIFLILSFKKDNSLAEKPFSG